uniref:Mating pheromone receptor Balpha8 n=1 Tax=Schizophyllum commune TaxID=5334 RepID=Q6UEE2_SCHCO|nr:mating pheromone receptor Balpha8 [Schizophyllum commune]
MHPEFAPVAFLSAASLLLPLPWHWRAGNVATLSIIAWLFIMNMIYGVNAVIWAGSARVTAIVWCDITTKLTIGGNFALPAACLCLCIHLEKVASVRASQTTVADKRRRMLFEFAMCWLLPIIFMALHYVVQGHRFDIVEDYGCRPATYFSIPAIIIVWVPPLLMAAISLVYASLAIRHFIRRRLSFSMHLSACHSALTTSRYLRLILMAIVQLVWLVVTTAYTLWFSSMTLPVRPWTNWADVHSNFSRIQTWPTILTPASALRGACTLWWMVPASTWIFVAFFAFGNDAVEEYKRCLNLVLDGARRIVPEKFLPEKKEKKGGFLPSFVGKAGSVPLPSPPPKSSMATSTTSSTLSMPPPYSLPPPLPPKKFTDPLDRIDYVAHDVAHGTVEYGIEGRRSDYIVNGAGDYVVDAHRMSLASSVDTSGYTIEVLPSMPPTPSTPSSSSSAGFPRSPSSRGSHAVDDYYYNASPSGTFEAPAPSPVPRVPSPAASTTSPTPSPAATSQAPQSPSPLAPVPPHYMRSEHPMSPRPLTYPAMSPTYRDIASTFSGGRR